jgi:hypothetical protein
MSVSSEDATNLLVYRLERLSADSPYAHRASGVKGAILHWLECEAGGEHPSERTLLELMELGQRILVQAAREMRR